MPRGCCRLWVEATARGLPVPADVQTVISALSAWSKELAAKPLRADGSANPGDEATSSLNLGRSPPGKRPQPPVELGRSRVGRPGVVTGVVW